MNDFIHLDTQITTEEADIIESVQQEFNLNMDEALGKIILDYDKKLRTPIENRLKKIEEQFSWWNADDTEHKISVLNSNMNKLNKKLKVLITSTKNLKNKVESLEARINSSDGRTKRNTKTSS